MIGTPPHRSDRAPAGLARHFEPRMGVVDIGVTPAIDRDPSYQLSLRSRMDLGSHVGFDLALRAVDALNRPTIPAFAEADARLSHRLSDPLELFVAGTNPLHPGHPESNDTDQSQAIVRSVYAGARVRF